MKRWNAYGWSWWWLPGSAGIVLNGWVFKTYRPNGYGWPVFKCEPNIWRKLGEPLPKKEQHGRHQ